MVVEEKTRRIHVHLVQEHSCKNSCKFSSKFPPSGLRNTGKSIGTMNLSDLSLIVPAVRPQKHWKIDWDNEFVWPQPQSSSGKSIGTIILSRLSLKVPAVWAQKHWKIDLDNEFVRPQRKISLPIFSQSGK